MTGRIESIDLAKGIGIILVVWAHASGPFSNTIYQFHMPFFFLLSGLLYNERDSVKDFTVKKLYRLYIPFVFWNVLSSTIVLVRNGYHYKVILRNAALIALTLSKDGTYFGATWFLGALFTVSVVYKIFDRLIRESKYKDCLFLILYVVSAYMAIQITLPYMLSRTVICGLYYALGVYVKRHGAELKGLNCLGTAVACGIIFAVISRHSVAYMGGNEYTYPILFLIGAVLASYTTCFICQCTERCDYQLFKVLKDGIIYLGRHSMDIVIWQFNAFRIVIVIQMWLRHDEITWSGVLEHYPCYITNSGGGSYMWSSV